MVRSLFKKAIIAFYCSLILMCYINQASNENNTTFFDRMPPPIRTLILHKYLTLKDAFATRNISKFFANFTPAIEPENKRYFKPFVNNIYYKSIGFSIAKYCLTLNDLRMVCRINYLMDSYDQNKLKIQNIYINSCAFLCWFSTPGRNSCIIFGGRDDFEDVIPVSHLFDVLDISIKMNKKAMIVKVINRFDSRVKCFSLGDPNFGGEMPTELNPSIKFFLLCTKYTCGVWNMESKKIYSWGNFHTPDEINPPQKTLENVKSVLNFSKSHAICVLFHNGTVVAWGNPFFGGKIPEHLKPSLKNVKNIFGNERGFAARINDTKIIPWSGEIFEKVENLLKHFKKVVFNSGAFAALANDGKVYAWGDSNSGGCISLENKKQLIGVRDICHYGSHKFIAYFDDIDRLDLIWP